MALLDPYLSADEFRQRVDSTDTRTDHAALLGEVLASVSRHVEHRLGVAVGYFNSDAGTRTFDGSGSARLWLRDDAGRAYCLTALTTVEVDHDGDGAHELALPTAALRRLPQNAAAEERPWTSLELLPAAPLSVWPPHPGAVRITGTWGWASIPGQVKTLVAMIANQVLKLQQAGPLSTLANLDEVVQLTPGVPHLLRELEADVGRRIAVLA